MRIVVKVVFAGALLMLSGCSLFTGKAPSNLPAPLVEFTQSLNVRQVWTVSIGSASIFAFAPAADGGSVHAASADGTVARVDAATGAVAWRINAGMRLTGGAGSDGNIVAVAGEKGILLAFDARGKKRWQAQVSSEILSAPGVGQGLVIVRSLDNRISAYDADTGERRWAVLRTLPSLTLRSASGVLVVPPGARPCLRGDCAGGARDPVPW